MLRDIGAASIAPFNSFLFLQGLETLSLRMERHVAERPAVAEWLEARDDGPSGCTYPGLASSPVVQRQQQLPAQGRWGHPAPSVSTVERRRARRFIEGLELFSHLANVGDVRSLVIHPASTTHSQLTEAEQITTGVTPDLVRLSLGLESIDDIIADLDAGFRSIKGT